MKSDEITIASRNDDLSMKIGTHLAEKVGGEWLSGDETVSKTTSLPQREVNCWPFCHRSGTIHEARALRPHHCFSKSTGQFWSIRQNKYRWYSSFGIEGGPFLKKMCCHIDWKSSQTKGQYPPDRSIKSREVHCFLVEWTHKSSVLLNASKQKVQQDRANACNQWFGNFKEVPPGTTVSVNKNFRSTYTDICVWKELAEMTLPRLIIFNKRHWGETAKFKVSSFENRPDWNATLYSLLRKSCAKDTSSVTFNMF